MREPSFWWRRHGGIGTALLTPLAAVYGAVAGARMGRAACRADVPVICIGNPTVGGAGKTPLAIAVAHLLAAAGEHPFLLTRGYGGRLAGPLQVDPTRHGASDVGDEALLLARVAPTVLAHDRINGAKAAHAAGASVIVMDDGFQNPALGKDLSVLVVDARRGIGNGRVIPAGPLRAPLATQLAHAQALVAVGEGTGADEVIGRAQERKLPVFRARLAPDAGFIAALGNGRVLAFAGIGDPAKFFATLRGAGIVVAATRSFPDHHRYSRREAEDLCRQADGDGLALVTTEKDLARMQGDNVLGELAGRTRALPVTMALEDEPSFTKLLEQRTRTL
jgi:tetraacyldisaccharide 4'-kinase